MRKVVHILVEALFLISLTLLGKFRLEEENFMLGDYQVVVTLFWVTGVFNFKDKKIAEVILNKSKDVLVALIIIPLWFWISGEMQYDLYEPFTVVAHLLMLGVIMLLTRILEKDSGPVVYYSSSLIPIISIILIKLNCSIFLSVLIGVMFSWIINYLFHMKICRFMPGVPKKVLRYNRKSSIEQVGREKYSFDKKEELLKYRYLCCVRLSRREWKKCKRINMPYSFQEWADDIKGKYFRYNTAQLEEFTRYLELGIRNHNINKESDNIIYAALASGIIAVILQQVMVLENLSISIFVINMLCMVSLVAFVVAVIYVSMRNIKIEQNMYLDYQKIINQIIKEKNEL